MENKDKIKLLEDFAEKLNSFKEFSKYENEVNFFEVTGMDSREIKHSNFLAWLLDSNANHNLKDMFVKKFIQKVIEANIGKARLNICEEEIESLNFDTFAVKREWEHIDIFLCSDELKYTISIENKIFASERENQTFDYREKVEPLYKGYKNIYIFLTREGDEAQDNEFWCSANYYMIAQTLKEILKEYSLSQEVEILIKNYLSMLLRRRIIVDKEIEKLCKKIYREHKKELDLIYEYRPDEVAVFGNYILNFIKENQNKYNLVFDKKYSTKNYIRFTTQFMNTLLPQTKDFSYGWKNGFSFLYEIDTKEQCCFGTIANISNEVCICLFKTTQSKGSPYTVPKKNKELPVLWEKIFKSQQLLKNHDEIELDLIEYQAELDEALKHLFEKEIPEYEAFVKKELQKK